MHARRNIRTGREFLLLHDGIRDETRQSLAFTLLLANLGPELAGLAAQFLGILLERDELLSPEIRLRHQEVQPARQAADLRLQIVASIHERGRTFTDGVLDLLLRFAEARWAPWASEERNPLQQRRFLVLQKEARVSSSPFSLTTTKNRSSLPYPVTRNQTPE